MTLISSGLNSQFSGRTRGFPQCPCYNISLRRPSTRQIQHIISPLDALQNGLGGDNLSVLRCLRNRALNQSHSIYVVGGPVRDVLMGMPIRDLDFVVEGDGPELARWLAEQLGGEVRVHPRFGTSTLILGSCRVDVVTARREIYPKPAALPQVTPGTIADDLARRDFTINSLALPLAEKNPEIIDVYSGIDDLRRCVIRVLHPKSFEDDPTRIFRALRYEQRLGFELEPGTLDYLNNAVRQGHLSSLTGDRIRHELEKILDEDHPEQALERCAALGILEVVHPPLGGRDAVERLTALTAGGPGPANDGSIKIGPLTYIAALVYPLSEIQAEEFIRRINAPGAWARVIREVVSLKNREDALVGDDFSSSQLAEAVEEYCAEALLAVARLTQHPLVSQRLSLYSEKLRHIGTTFTGNDLLEMGVAQGPEVGRLLRELREAKLDATVSTEEDERRWLEEHII